MKEKERNVEIVGLNWKKDEDVMGTVKSLASKLNIDPKTICEIKKVGEEKLVDKTAVGGKNGGGGAGEKSSPPPPRPRSLVLTLSSRADRDQWLTKKKTRLTNADVYGDDSTNAPIFINEDLPKPMKQLLWSVKNELKPKPFKYVWVQDGKILLKREDPEDRKIWVIRTADDLARVKAEAGRAQKAKAANT
ncbi:hypothetical protein O0L34_g4742 [Tuta absoluta]|nr:hypothetical protein O0L34_g4742 [Tuta absoluta]